MNPPSDRTATPAGFPRNARLVSIGTGGWLRSESMADFVGIRTGCHAAIASGVTHTVRLPRSRGAASYSRQFSTRYRAFGML